MTALPSFSIRQPRIPLCEPHGQATLRRANALHGAVAALLVTVADSVVMPRFRNLLQHEVTEKSRGELVTIVDHEAERRLCDGLARIDPGARYVGEEACAANPSLIEGLGYGRVWLIDPIDGTANFAAGRGPFGIMIALVEDGVTVAGWLYDPVSRRLCHALAGGGAFIDDAPFHVRSIRRERPIAALATQFMTPAARARIERRGGAAFDLAPIPRCAAEHYPRIALGENDVALFQRTLPWDHAPGVLFLEEAGGMVSRWDGTPYRVDDGGTGLIAATSTAAWALAMAALAPGDPDFLRDDG